MSKPKRNAIRIQMKLNRVWKRQNAQTNEGVAWSARFIKRWPRPESKSDNHLVKSEQQQHHHHHHHQQQQQQQQQQQNSVHNSVKLPWGETGFGIEIIGNAVLERLARVRARKMATLCGPREHRPFLLANGLAFFFLIYEQHNANKNASGRPLFCIFIVFSLFFFNSTAGHKCLMVQAMADGSPQVYVT